MDKQEELIKTREYVSLATQTPILIGYQGFIGSNSEEAAKTIAVKLRLKNVNFLPLISSKNVVKTLLNGEINYGVMAIRNSSAGTVEETDKAVLHKNLALKTAESIAIHHCLFKKIGIDDADITKIASHKQALRQTAGSLKKLFPKASIVEIADTAIGAKWLSEGKLDNNIAVVCSKSAGLANGLALIKENLEDSRDNHTEFGLFSAKD